MTLSRRDLLKKSAAAIPALAALRALGVSTAFGAPARMNVISATQTKIHMSVHFRHAGREVLRTRWPRVARLLHQRPYNRSR